MCTLLIPDYRPLMLTFQLPFFNKSYKFHVHKSSRSPRSYMTSSFSNKILDLSWSDPVNTHLYGGWEFLDSPIHKNIQKKGLSALVLGGVWISVAALVALIGHFSLRRSGFKFQLSRALHVLPHVLMSNKTDIKGSKTADVKSTAEEFVDKQERVIIPSHSDSTQQDAVFFLKKLKIIEDEFKLDELCTRREYARWLSRSNSLLERNPKHQIAPSILPSRSVIPAFDDISTVDSDFWSIQALAEAGIVLSKLSVVSTDQNLDGLKDKRVYFFPERFVSRQDLINWKAQLEYELIPEIEEKIANANVDYMDAKEINADMSPEFFMDINAGDNSIFKKVFGQSKRIQPNKPITKAQAAVAIVSGRMTEAISSDLSRLKAENSFMQSKVIEICSELLREDDMQKFWDEKLEELQSLGLEVERVYLFALRNLEFEKIIQEKALAGHLKQKGSIECQRKLLLRLKGEVNEMSERLIRERCNYSSERRDLHNSLSDLHRKQESMLDSKSFLGAEKEALGMLRSWVEDEAWKNHARAKVLEVACQRWKWVNQP